MSNAIDLSAFFGVPEEKIIICKFGNKCTFLDVALFNHLIIEYTSYNTFWANVIVSIAVSVGVALIHYVSIQTFFTTHFSFAAFYCTSIKECGHTTFRFVITDSWSKATTERTVSPRA